MSRRFQKFGYKNPCVEIQRAKLFSLLFQVPNSQRLNRQKPLPMSDTAATALLDRRGKYNRSVSHVNDEFHTFRSYLRWMCVDQSNAFTAALSWSVFLLLAVIVPAASHFLLACPDCDGRHSRPYDGVVQVSLTTVATLSFLCLAGFVRKYGLRRFLFFDKLCDESETVKTNYMAQLNVCLLISLSLLITSSFFFNLLSLILINSDLLIISDFLLLILAFCINFLFLH